MKSGKSACYHNIKSWSRIRTILLYALIALLVCSTVVIILGETFGVLGSIERTESRAQIKARLMRQARYEGWDPYSADMTLDEFYALMELFDEGKLPLDKKAAKSASADGAQDEPIIPRTKFLFSGLPAKFLELGDDITPENQPQEYDNKKNYEEKGYDSEGNQLFYYPEGLDPYSRGYKRPPEMWDGVRVDSSNLRALVVLEEENADPAIASKVDQSLFVHYKDYYVKQITVDGADINILGMIQMPENGEYVCYFLSAEAQSTQVSTTTMPDPQKFIVEYVPVEHMVSYKVEMADGTDVPEGINEESIFGSYHPSRTTDGAYSFDVTAPYGYTTRIYICIDMYKKLWFATTPNGDGTNDHEEEIRSITDNDFPVRINHTGFYQNMKTSWLQSYYDYLCEIGFINDGKLFDRRSNKSNVYRDDIIINNYDDFLDCCIHQEGKDEDRNIVLTWKIEDDPNKEAHDSMLVRMTQRINDFILHNSGYDLGTSPTWILQNGTKLVPDASAGPVAYTWNETFYNHLVQADRRIVAVLTPIEQPTFSNKGVSSTNNMSGRGANAHDEWANATDDRFEQYYVYENASYDNGGLDSYQADGWPNVKTDEYNWTWPKEGIIRDMTYDEATDTYSHNWMFQTNEASEGFTLDVLEINGVAMTLPYRPRYQKMNYDNGKTPEPDENFSWQTVNYLPDGAKVTVQFWFGWKKSSSSSDQRHYRIMIEGAHTDVTITSLNLMMGTGAKEFSVYSLTGVHSDAEGDSQTTEAIEYYNNKKGWVRMEKSQVVVDKSNDLEGYISYDTADSNSYHANIRFKVADGFGNPYYLWESPRYGITRDSAGNYQASVDVTMGNNFAMPNLEQVHEIVYFSELKELDSGSDYLVDGKLNCTYVYYDDIVGSAGYGYYYIRVTGQKNPINQSEDLKIALLTIVARTVRYVVRYIPGEVTDSNGVTPENMPQFVHNGDCVFKDAGEIGAQYDDNGGAYYDLLVNTRMSIPSNENGVIRPTDPNNEYRFVDWVLVGEDFEPVLDKHGEQIHFLSGAIDLTEISHHAVHRVTFSTLDMDIYVIRFMPTWKIIDDPFVYSIVINWVDALGNVTQQNFSDWEDIVTEKPETNDVYVYINKLATPFFNWFATHPTYTFWNDVNNALNEETIKQSLTTYLEQVKHTEKYEEILNELLKTDFTGNGKEDFARLGDDIFAVHDDGGTICIWMYEALGGIVFNTDVKEEAFVPDEEFYFTVTSRDSLNGTYRAFPQYVFNGDGTRKELTDAEAWVVTFKDGAIESIVKNGVNYGTYFKLKKGEEVALYVPTGEYEIHELGSKSGAPYLVDVKRHDSLGNDPEHSSCTLPPASWLKGNSTEIRNDSTVSQLYAQVSLAVGEKEIVEAITFYNQTSSLSIENHLGEMSSQQEAVYKSEYFKFKVTLTLPDDQTPFTNEAGKYYFNMNVYRNVDGKAVVSSTQLELTKVVDDINAGNAWVGTLALKPEETAVIVMTDSVSYVVEETETHGLTPYWTSQSGTAHEGRKSLASCTNYLPGSVPTVTHGYLVIKETGGKSNESFLFVITFENGTTLTVSVKGGGKTYVYAPLGKYTIEEMSDWSWRYENGKSGEDALTTLNITESNATKANAAAVTYSHSSNNKGWLGGESSKKV